MLEFRMDYLPKFYVLNKGNNIKICILADTPLQAAAKALKRNFIVTSPDNFTEPFFVDERGFRDDRSQDRPSHTFAAQEVFAEANFDIDGGAVVCV